MWCWTWRSFLDERAGLAASAAGVAVVFLLVMILQGAFQGEADQVVALVEHSDAPLWVMQKGVANMHMAASALDADTVVAVERVNGVAAVEPIVYGGGWARLGEVEQALYLVGVRPGQRVGPWDLADGRNVARPGEAVVPMVLARRGGVGLGDALIVDQRRFRVVGLSRGTYSMANSLVFLHAADVAALFDQVADSNFLLVWTTPGVEAGALASRLRAAVPGVTVLGRSTLLANDRALALQMGGGLVGIMSVVAALVAALIIAFTVFTFATRRARELALAKAVGGRPWQLLAAGAGQAAALTLLGYLLALLGAAVLQPIFSAWAPGIIIHFAPASLARLGAVALVVAVISGVWPSWRVLRLDPSLVFSS